MEQPQPYIPQNRAQRRRLIKAYKGFKPKTRQAAQVMNRHLKIRKAEAAAQRAITEEGVADNGSH